MSMNAATSDDQEMQMNEKISGENCAFLWERAVDTELTGGCESVEDFTATDDDVQAVPGMNDEASVADLQAISVAPGDELSDNEDEGLPPTSTTVSSQQVH